MDNNTRAMVNAPSLTLACFFNASQYVEMGIVP